MNLNDSSDVTKRVTIMKLENISELKYFYITSGCIGRFCGKFYLNRSSRFCVIEP